MLYVTRRPPPNPLLLKEGKKPAVLLVLHGYGTDEYDLLPIAEQIGGGFLIISLQAPVERPNGGHAWYDLIQTENGIVPDDFSRHESEEMLVASLANIIDQEGGDVNRVMLMGFSQGAAVIYSLLTVYDLKNYGITPSLRSICRATSHAIFWKQYQRSDSMRMIDHPQASHSLSVTVNSMS